MKIIKEIERKFILNEKLKFKWKPQWKKEKNESNLTLEIDSLNVFDLSVFNSKFFEIFLTT
jgi:hypothetical protein